MTEEQTGTGQVDTETGRPIEGQVAAVLNEVQIAINRGRGYGVTRGMKFEVLEPEGVPITDPETGLQLGEETGVKIRVKVVRVEDDYSVAESDEFFPGTKNIGDSLFSASLGLKSQPTRQRTLRTEEAIFPALKEEKSYVKRGDPVREIQA